MMGVKSLMYDNVATALAVGPVQQSAPATTVMGCD